LSFYRNNLNRMTLADLGRYAVEAGFTVLAIVPWTKKGHWARMTGDILADCISLYPSIQAADLISPFVWVLLKKPQ
jgi:hypothetical protein